MIYIKKTAIIFFAYCLSAICAQGLFAQKPHQALDNENRWVDSVYKSLTTEERIAQLIFVRANQPGKPYDLRVAEYISRYNIGGVTFFKGKPEDQLAQTNAWQLKAKTPLLISIDGEWGLGMRITGTVSYPYQMTIGAIKNDSLIYQMGSQIARQCKRMGIHINFAPVVDVNNNAVNPVIGMRSFGDSPADVGRKGSIYAKALKDGGIIATAKHFPGHGDTKNDSHYTLPVILHQRNHLDSNELLPFRRIIADGVEGIMIAHLNIPALDSNFKTPSTLSYKIVTELLQNELGFNGLIVTDGLDMKGVTEGFEAGTIELMALQAGNDVLLLPENVPLAIETIKKAVETGHLSKKRLEESCRKVLSYKYKVGLNAYRQASLESLNADLNKKEYVALMNQMFAEAVTLLKNENNILPLNNDTIKWALLTIGTDKKSEMTDWLTKSGINVKPFYFNKKSTKEQVADLKNKLRPFGHIIVNIQNTNILAANKFGIENDAIALVNDLAKSKSIVLNIFASPYALNFFENRKNIKAVVIGYQDKAEVEKSVTDILIGAKQAKGRLPVSLQFGYKNGHGLQTRIAQGQKIETEPTERSFITENFIENIFTRKIDSIALDGIRKKAYPGCQIVAIKDAKIIYQKSFGFYTYDSVEKVTDSTLYDLASLTKILASTLAIMKLSEEGKVNLDATLSSYFPFLNATDKAAIKLIDILSHQSGFNGWIPFYQKTLAGKEKLPDIYSTEFSLEFPNRVAENLYIHRAYKHNIFNEIATSALKTTTYRYSDLGFFFIPPLVELITNEEFDLYLKRVFYQPMGLRSVTFRPLSHFSKNMIAPTENDTLFRKQIIRGDVHDPGAAMLGGISGHAGLFGNAKDVALMMQMLLDEGQLNGNRILKAETIKNFNTAHFATKNNRRGIGLDKPPLNPADTNRAISDSASLQSFGHTGFTGTFAWSDPKNNLVVVFLSNRVFPDAAANQLSKLSIRPKIHSLFYKAIAAHP